MPRKPISFELDFMIKDIFPRFTVKQFDDVSFNIKPKNQGLDYDTTGMTGKIFVGVNNDMFMQTTGITVSNNNINILLDRNMLQKQGRAYAEVELTDSNGTITSSSFIFDIDPKIGEGGQIPGEYEGFVEKYERLISEFKSQVNSTINNCNTNVNSAIKQCNTNVDNKLNAVDSLINVKISDFEKRFNTLTSSRQQESEVIDARDGEVSLKARLDRDLYKDGISLSDRIEAIEGLKDSQNMKYETDKGYLVCKETKNGVIDDLKIEGKTLVNRTDIFNKVNPTGGGAHRKTSNSLIVDYNKCGELDNSYSLDEIDVFKSGQIYTIIIDIIQNTLNQKVEFYPMIWDFATVISGTQDVNTGEIGRKIFVIKANKDYALKLGYASPSQATQGVTGLVEFKDIMVLDGDYTNIELPNYFEGLMSVGQDVDKIEVLSNNGNLFDLEKWIQGVSVTRGNIQNHYDGSFTLSSTGADCHTGIVTSGIVPVEERCKLVNIEGANKITVSVRKNNTSGSIMFYGFYDESFNVLGFNSVRVDNLENTNIITNNYPNAKYLMLRFGVDVANTSITFSNIMLSKGTTPKPYTPHQSDKKQILFYNENGELEPVTELHEWDSIEKHSDNKWYYHKRSGKVVLNGSENWIRSASPYQTNTKEFTLEYNDAKPLLKTDIVICDKFSTDYELFGRDVEAISIYQKTTRIAIGILNSKLNGSETVEGFKQWLQTNNVTVVYQLAQEEVYELAPLHLDSYANETLILCNSGAISPKMEFSITSHINELVKAYGERINLLEEKVYKYMVTQNRMQLASTYSADSVTFKVDYFSLCGDEENYDEDLYNLILNNILVGKDNYDYDKMFTIILDYASWNQISWEQFDILVGLMDMQHNPPVEELPTEDEIEEIPNEIE